MSLKDKYQAYFTPTLNNIIYVCEIIVYDETISMTNSPFDAKTNSPARR